MDYEDKFYWLEEIRTELGVLREEAETVDEVDDYTCMIECIDDIIEDMYRLRSLED